MIVMFYPTFVTRASRHLGQLHITLQGVNVEYGVSGRRRFWMGRTDRLLLTESPNHIYLVASWNGHRNPLGSLTSYLDRRAVVEISGHQAGASIDVST
jgi:hypothetical protein